MAVQLHDLLENSAIRYPDNIALLDGDAHSITYRELNIQATAIAKLLLQSGVSAGDRVGVYAQKSIPLVAALFGILKAGAAYVPVDPSSPISRAAYIFNDCAVVAIVGSESLLAALHDSKLGSFGKDVGTIDRFAPQSEHLQIAPGPGAKEFHRHEEIKDLAYILYTSGSTGHPKGVIHRHPSAMSFVGWCSEILEPTSKDRFSSHAPFHFDLSILDLYVPIAHGASVVLIDDQLGKQPAALAELIATTGITVWYSTPSILRLLVEFGKLEQFDCSSLRIVCFAGEVFPIKHFEALVACWPKPRYFNLYGPTETNVCTYYEVTAGDHHGRSSPLPIGRVCSNDQARVIDPEGKLVAAGGEGELLISGGSVMFGYWNLSARNAEVFLVDDDGTRWYRTGDIVIADGEGSSYTFVGRRDRMVKRRSYRVELGEIEAALYRHPAIREAAAIAKPDDVSGVEITAFVSCDGTAPPSIIDLKRFSSEQVPIYMVPDRFRILPVLPKTSTDKIDYQRLKDL